MCVFIMDFIILRNFEEKSYKNIYLCAHYFFLILDLRAILNVFWRDGFGARQEQCGKTP